MTDLHLHASSLCSKWGFGDGDTPDSLLDWADEQPESVRRLVYDVEWHDVLRTLVRRHLLPALAERGHRVEVYDIETIHNPIRASVVDGREVDSRDHREDWDRYFGDLSVAVPLADVLAAIREVGR